MKLVKYLCWLFAFGIAHVSAAFAIDTPDFVLERGRWEQLVIPAASSDLTARQHSAVLNKLSSTG